MNRRSSIKVLLIALLMQGVTSLTGCGTSPSASSGAASNGKNSIAAEKNLVINIGTQALDGPMYLAEKKGWFEQAFAKVGVKVNWVRFTSGPPFFPAIASNHIDFGQVGNAPVLVGQAANVGFQEIAVDSDGKHGDAVLVPKDSSIHSIQDLKGKKIAVAEGSSAYNLLYQALAAAGLNASQVHIVQLQPNEAQPAFESHAVDAWATWDPYVTEEVSGHGAVMLTNEEDLHTASPGFTIVRTNFAKEYPNLVVLFLQVYQQALDWQNSHLNSALQIYAQATHLSLPVVKQLIQNSDEENSPITPNVINEQQKTADFLYSQNSLSTKLDVSQVVNNTFLKQALQSTS